MLILGAKGMGRSALAAHLRESLTLRVCPVSEYLGPICGSLEAEIGLAAGDSKLLQRKHRLLRALANTDRTVVFDGARGRLVLPYLPCVGERFPLSEANGRLYHDGNGLRLD